MLSGRERNDRIRRGMKPIEPAALEWAGRFTTVEEVLEVLTKSNRKALERVLLYQGWSYRFAYYFQRRRYPLNPNTGTLVAGKVILTPHMLPPKESWSKRSEYYQSVLDLGYPDVGLSLDGQTLKGLGGLEVMLQRYWRAYAEHRRV